MAESYKSAQIVSTAAGVQYHVGVGPGDVAERIMLVGDPARADKVAKYFDEVTVRRANREYVTITGTYKGHPLTVTATGIGCDNTEIAVVELCQVVENPTFLRVGSSGALQDEIGLGDLVISTGAVKLESTSHYFVPEGFPSVAHPELVMACLEATRGIEGRAVHCGITGTAPGFYGPQGRVVPGFPPRNPNIPDELSAVGVKNLEMEASLLFTLANLRGVRAGAICAIFASRKADTFVDTDMKAKAELACIEAGLETLEIVRRMDAARGDDAYWRPGHGLGA